MCGVCLLEFFLLSCAFGTKSVNEKTWVERCERFERTSFHKIGEVVVLMFGDFAAMDANEVNVASSAISEKTLVASWLPFNLMPRHKVTSSEKLQRGINRRERNVVLGVHCFENLFSGERP